MCGVGMNHDRDRRWTESIRTLIGLFILLTLSHKIWGSETGKLGYFSKQNNSYVLLPNTIWNVRERSQQTEFSFRTCSNGELLSQNGSGGDSLRLSLVNGMLEFDWTIGTEQSKMFLGTNLNSNQWFTLNSHHYLGNLFLNVSQSGKILFSEIISNSTFQTYFTSINLTGTIGLYVGQSFTGCLMEGPNVIFVDNAHIQWNNVEWSNTTCPFSGTSCSSSDGDLCYNFPCKNEGTCVDGESNYTCICKHLFNGTNCENDLGSMYGCAVQPCLNSGTCEVVTTGTRNYRCRCSVGFTGDNCESDIDECGPNLCQNGVQCIDKIGQFECNCTGSGYNGTLCERDINECEQTTNICGDGITCYNNPGSYTCGCPGGTFGTNCEDINECSSTPCGNNGTCQNLNNTFNCLCVAGFTGFMCEMDINDCENVTCPGNYSQCDDRVNGYVCVCKPGYTETTPTNCVDINECDSSPCQHGATCQDEVNGYSCACAAGYTDINCSTDIDDCQPNPCQHGATCRDGIAGYQCDCPAGYDGNQCENNINECLLHNPACHNGGICVDGVASYTCLCAIGYTGDRCFTDIDECATSPCGVHSTMCTQGIGTFNCTCQPGYTGQTCDTDYDECQSNPCQNSGTCTDKVNRYECNCTADWMGMTCDRSYDACSPELQNCKNGASCMSHPPSHEFNCMCPVGFTGDQCETNIDDCSPGICLFPLICYDEVNSHRCACPRGFEGSNCSIPIDECRSNPCQNGATCMDGPGNYTCQCVTETADMPDTNVVYTTGFKGENCEYDIDECAITPSICLNGGTCENEAGSFQCKCGRDASGNYFTGSHCEITTSYCFIADDIQGDLPACKNNGTCRGLIGSYECDCVPGFTGQRCEININECESSPCQYNSTCNDGINGYTCDCIPGITGTNCEINIQECESSPCNNGGRCIDDINRFDCDCYDTGFKGDTCEINIDDCESSPCIHGSTCEDLVKDYKCHCFPGYDGKECQIDVDECLATPCHFNSPCYQKSNRTLYEIDTPGFEGLNFSYANASGYICDCVQGSEGLNCETNIDDCNHGNCNNGSCFDLLDAYRCDCFRGYEGVNCEKEINECDRYTPCQHGFQCTDKVADYYCECVIPYAGKNCTFELTSCQGHKCQNGATCKPYLVNEATAEQNYDCLCGVGYTGRYCNISTTMSFDTGSYVKTLFDVSGDVVLSFRFRTTLKDSILLAWTADVHISRLFLTVELKDGNLYLSYHADESASLSTKTIPNKTFNDGLWKHVTIRKDRSITMTVTGLPCVSSSSDCVISTNYHSSGVVPQSRAYFGGLQDTSKIPETVSGTQFVGCMEDVTVMGTRLVLNTSSNFHNLVHGCPRQEPCDYDTCNEKGTCVDLWNKYRCDCDRPNLGDNCETAYIAATFSYSTTEGSYATFNLSDSLKDNVTGLFDMSFFIRSRKPNGLILFFGNLESTFVALELESGHLKLRLKFCNGFEENVYTNRDSFADGNQHLVRIYRNNQEIKFYANSEIITENLISSCVFEANELTFGTKAQSTSLGRRRRETVTAPVTDFSSVADYKGTVQDIQLNDQSLQFYPLSDPSLSPLPVVNVIQSADLQQDEVTDPVCELQAPCENNSTCTNKFFNDFSCACLHGYRGKNCSELDFCVTGTCPDGSNCQSLMDGFECISNATFMGSSSMVSYTHTLSNTSQIRTFSFTFRTLAMNGWIAWIGNNAYYYKVKVEDSDIVILYSLDGTGEMTLRANHDVANAMWYKAKVTEGNDKVTLTLYDHDELNVYANVSGVRPTGGESLTKLLMSSSSNIQIGKLTNMVGTSNLFFQGCMEDFRIGNILLPFFTDESFVNNTSVEKFLLKSGHVIKHGCSAGPGCRYSQCKHASACVNDYYTYTCDCGAGYRGRWCENRETFCHSDPCVNGQCSSTLDNYQCNCESGYSGTRCEDDVNECTSFPCLNNGSCQNDNGTYTCSCGAGYAGDRCEALLNETCSSNPCVHGVCTNITTTDQNTGLDTFNCTCTPGYEGYKCDVAIDYCSNVPCHNGATCVSNTATQTYTCTCSSGFTGDKCDTSVDDCTSDACKHGGVCIDGFNAYVCNCSNTIYWDGDTCENDIDECERNQPCQNGGVCQNTNGNYSCNCDSTGYEGRHCERDVDECSLSICKNGASCTNSVGNYSCNCTDGYEEKDCQVPNCDLISCKNSATCQLVNNDQQWRCQCLEFYEGELCEIKGQCADRPCNESNTLNCSQNISIPSYSCLCKAGWRGTNCTEDVDECSETPIYCKNGGTCVNQPGLYKCDCAKGFDGNFCGNDIDECFSTPCNNEGYCIDGKGTFECNCTGTGFTNLTCQDDVDECLDQPCYNGGECQNSEGSYRCICKDGYEGQNCDVKHAAMQDDITWYIVGPCVAIVLILIIIGIVWFLMCVRSKRATRGAYSPSRQEVSGSRVELGNVMKKPPLERLI